jgi:hypothetical protein
MKDNYDIVTHDVAQDEMKPKSIFLRRNCGGEEGRRGESG